MPAPPIRRFRLLLGFGLALAVVAVIVLVSFRSTTDASAAARSVAHTHEVISTLRGIMTWVEAAETAQRGYVITTQQDYAEEAASARPKVAASMRRLQALVHDNPEQYARVSELRNAIEVKLAYVQSILNTVTRGDHAGARRMVLTGEGKRTMERVTALIETMEREEYALLERRQKTSAEQARRARMLLIAGGLADLVLLAFVFGLVRRDQNRRHAAANALKAARDEAVRASEMRAQFLANMTHEIRTPMNAIIGMSGLLLDTELDTNQRELAETVRGSADALLTVINDVLDFSKLEAGKLAIETYDFELRPAVEGVIDLFTEQARQKKLTLATIIDHALPQRVRGDAGRIRQVLTNLVGNAIKFTSQGDVVVQVEFRERRPGAVVARFNVRDTGIGIDPEAVPRLFQAFTQADASTTRKFGGTGLGLAISRQIIESMQGTIGVDSEPDKGSTFWFEIPLQEAAMTEESRALSLESLHEAHVLIVDDNATNRRVLRHNLAAWRMTPDEAEGVDEALGKMRSAVAAGAPYDLVLTDLHLAQGDGLVLARLVRSDPSLAKTRIIVLSSAAQRLDAAKMQAAGIDECLTKPVKQSALFDAIVTSVSGAIAAAPRKATPRPAALPLRHDVRVLIAEDNPVNQKVAIRQLERLGIAADAVANGLEAVEAVSRRQYSLVFMDLQMPEMDGIAATREIRAREQAPVHVPIVALTANALAGDRERCLASGMDDYLAKPIIEKDLARVIERFLPRAPGSDAPPLDEAVIAGLRELGGVDFLREVFAIYRDDARLRLETIREGVASNDEALVASAAHALKSSAGNVGALVVRGLCEVIEAAGQRGVIDEERIARLMEECDRVEHELRRLTEE